MSRIDNLKKIIVLILFSFVLFGCSIHDREEAFKEEDIFFYSKKNYAVGEMEFIEDYYEDNQTSESNWKYHYFKYREKNERGLEFVVVDVKHYDSKFTSSYYYGVKTNFDQNVILDYVTKYALPSGSYLSNEKGGYSFSMSEGLEKPYKIVVPYSGDKDFNEKMEQIYDYLVKMNDYNKEITGSKNNLYVYLVFVDDNNKSFDVRVHNKNVAANSECSYKGFTKCVSKYKKR